MFLHYVLPSLLLLHSSLSAVCTLSPSPSAPARRVTPKVASAWFAGFHTQEGFPVSSISWDRYTHMFYAFAETTPDVSNITLEGSDPPSLPLFVKAAKANNVKAGVSIGGWTGSRWYSSNVGSAKNRTAFVKTVTDFVTQYELDAIDFDWEYPGNQGIGCNTIKPQDTANFLSFLQELRQDPVGKNLILSAATGIAPFADANGDPMSDVSAFKDVLDWVGVMNYDIWGPWSPTVGPNAPLNDTCAPSSAQAGSAASAVQAWSAAGMPAAQIVLGVPAYGHAFRVAPSAAYTNSSNTTLALYPSFDAGDMPVGDKWDDAAGTDECGNAQAQGGLFDFWGLVDGGFLTPQGDAAEGIGYRFDECTQTPYVYNETSQVMVSFDNAQSFAAKGSFIKDAGLGGFAVWEAGGDEKNILLDSIREVVCIMYMTGMQLARSS